MSTQIHYHNVVKVEVGAAKLSGGTESCPHVFSHRDITITTRSGERHTVSMFADTIEELEFVE